MGRNMCFFHGRENLTNMLTWIYPDLTNKANMYNTVCMYVCMFVLLALMFVLIFELMFVLMFV